MNRHGATFFSRYLPGGIASLAIGALLLAACQSAPPPQPTTQPAPAATKPAAPPATQPTAKPAAPVAAPTTAPAKPAAQPTAASAAPATKQKATIRTSWFSTGLNAPYFLGVEKGFYADEGLDIEVLEGKGSGSTIKLIGNATDTLGEADAGTMAQAIGQGVPVKMVGGLLQKSPIAILSLKETGIKTPKDLEGKSIAMPADSGQAQMFPVLIELNKVDQSKVKMVNMDAAAIVTAVLTKKADALASYSPTIIPAMEEAGAPPAVLHYADFGVNTLSNGLVANVNTIKSNPDLIKKITRATIKSWAAARENPDAAVAAYVKGRPELKPNVVKRQLELYLQYLETANTKGKPLGWMSEKDWEETLDILMKSKMIQKKESLDTYFSNDFLGS